MADNGQNAFQQAIQRRIERIQNLEPVMKKISIDMKKQIQLRFRKEESSNGTKWGRLKESTLKNRPHGGDKPLNDTGNLKNSINSRFGKKFAIAGTNVKYARVMQFGARKGTLGTTLTRHGKTRFSPWGDIPARPFIGFSNKQQIKYKKMIFKFINEGVQN